jgi:eukaryotic-like serine/threonine-protein kinase
MREEGRLLASLRHPAILRVLDLTTIGGRATLVTEFVEGADLSALQSTRLPVRLVIEIVGTVADALDTAWSTPGLEGDEPLRLVHRDVKPSNIRLGCHGEVKLLDFGIAWSAGEGRQAQTQANGLVGSLAYMAPERFTGAPVEHSSDVYSLGCVLYEALVGERLNAADTPARAAMLVSLPERYTAWLEERLLLLPPDTPPEVADLLRKMLTYDAGARLGARAVSVACERLIDDLHGPRLKSWAREREWNDEALRSGPLTGQSLDELSTDPWQRLGPGPDGDATATRTFDGPGTFPPPVPAAVDRPPTLASGPRARPRRTLAIVAAAAILLCGVGVVAWFTAASRGGPASVAEAGSPSLSTPDAGAATMDPTAARVEGSPTPGAGATPVPAAPPPAAIPVRTASRTVPPPTPPPAAAKAPAAAVATPASSPAAVPAHEEPASGEFRATGGVPVRLRGPAGTYEPGVLPAGTYEILADFGAGLTSLGRAQVRSGSTLTLHCNPMKWTCEESR